MQSSHKPLALDFAVISALGPSHWDDTWRTPAGAAEAYSVRKRHFHCTEQVCLQVGIQYRPIVLESQGGYSRAAASLLHRLADVVASAEGTDASVIRQRMFEQIAIAVARAKARAIKRRRHCTTNAASSLSTQAELFVTPPREPLVEVKLVAHAIVTAARLFMCYVSPLSVGDVLPCISPCESGVSRHLHT